MAALLVLFATTACSEEIFFADSSSHNGYWADPEARVYRTGALDPRVRQVPASLDQALKAQPAATLPKLVDFLLQGASDDLQRVKRIHDWIVDRIAYDSQAWATRVIPDQDVAPVLSRRSAVCDGFANLLSAMALEAGLEVATVHGKAKGASFTSSGALADHSWNAVRAGQRWYLVDTTRDAGYTVSGAFKRQYSTRFLFLAPAAFIHSNLPDHSPYQLLHRPLSLEQFVDQPYLSGHFFEQRLELLTRTVTNKTYVYYDYLVELRAPPGVQLKATLTSTSGQDQPQSAFSQRQGDRIRVLLNPPSVGTHVAQLYVSLPQSSGASVLRRVATFGVERTTTKGARRNAYPLEYQTFVQRAGYLTSPMEGELLAGVKRYFRVAVPGAKQVYLARDANTALLQLKPHGGDEFAGHYTPTAGTGTLYVVATFKGGAATRYLLLRYTVH